MSGTVILIKYSDATTGVNQPAQDVLEHAEQAYTFKNGVLWIGEDNGSGTIISKAIGGELYVSMLDHNAGTLTASSAIIVDQNKWIDEVISGGLTLTSTSGGTGQKVTSISTDVSLASVSDTQLATTRAIKSYVDSKVGLTSLTLLDDDGTQSTLDLDSQTVTFGSGDGLNSELTVNTDGDVTISYGLTTTGVSAGSYGSTTAIPTFTVDDKGRLTAAGTVAIATTLSIDSDDATPVGVDLLNETLVIAGGAGLTSSTLESATDGTVTITLDIDDVITAGSVGSSTEIPVITYNSKGQITGVTTAAISTALVVVDDSNNQASVDLGTDDLIISGGTNLTSVVSEITDGTVTLTINHDTSGVTAGTYGSSSTPSIPIITVDSQGHVTSAESYTGKTTFNSDGAGTVDINLGSSLTISGGTGLTTSITGTTLSIDLDDVAGLVAQQYGSATAIPQITVDAQGRISAIGTVDINANSFGTFTVTDTDTNFSWAETGSTVATANAATLTVVSGSGINVDVDSTNDAIRISNTGVRTLAGSNHISVDASTGEVTVTSDASVENVASTIVARDADGSIYANVLYVESIGLSDLDIVNNKLSVKTSSAYDNLILQGNTNGLVEIDDNLDVTGNVYISGDLTVVGSTTTISATNLSISDNMIYLNGNQEFNITDISGDGTYVTYTVDRDHGLTAGRIVNIFGNTPSEYNLQEAVIFDVPTSNTFRIENTTVSAPTVFGEVYLQGISNPDIGIAANYNDGTYAHAGFFRDATDGVWQVYDGYTLEPDASTFIDTTHASYNLADFKANQIISTGGFTGDLTGNASTASQLETSRTITFTGDVAGSFVFDGSADVSNVSLTIQQNSVALGTDTTGNYVATIASAGDTISITNSGTESAAVNLEVNLTNADFINAVKDAVAEAITDGTQTNISVTYNDANNSISFSISAATTSTLGVAKFSAVTDSGANQFTVSDGAPFVARIEGGTF